MDNCIFCKIIRGEIPSEKVYEDECCIAFRDINPQMPVHIIVAAKRHVSDILGFQEEDAAFLGKIQLAVCKDRQTAEAYGKRIPCDQQLRKRREAIGSPSALPYSCRRRHGRKDRIKLEAITAELNDLWGFLGRCLESPALLITVIGARRHIGKRDGRMPRTRLQRWYPRAP